MNHVDALLTQPFHRLKLEEKMHVINAGPHQPQDFQLQVKKRSFCCNWYTVHEWLTVSLGKQKLFCFYCLLFTNPFETDKAWSSSGFKDLHHFARSAKKHAASESHLNSVLRFKTFGTTSRFTPVQLESSVQISVKRHYNENVDKNRQVLKRIIEAIIFCGVHEFSPQGHDEKEPSCNRGVVLDQIKRLSTLDSQLEGNLNSVIIEKYTSNTVQNELLDCIFEVYREELYKDLSMASFVAIEAVETTDLSCCSQFVIILRFIKNKTPVERVLKIVDVKERSAKGLANVLQQELKDLNVKEKLIAQAYDGAAVMSGSKGVHAILRQEFPNAHYVHSYAHQINLIFKNLVNHVSKVRIFFTNLTGFATFFSVSPKRSDILREVCSKASIPQSSQTRWSFQSRLIESVHDMQNQLLICFDEIIESSHSGLWDDTTVREAYGLRRLLNDHEFQYLLTFLNDVFRQVDILYQKFQERVTSGTKVASCVTDFVTSVTKIRNSVQEPEYEISGKRNLNTITSLKAAVVEVCDILTTELTFRILGNAFLSAFCILNTKHFYNYRLTFPYKHVNVIIDKYPFLSKQHLINELIVVYQNEIFSNQNCPSLLHLYSTFLNIGLRESFTEIVKLIEIILTTPIASAEPDRCFNTLKRVKTFLRSSMTQDRLNALAILSIHKEEIHNVPEFDQKVIQRFAETKNRRVDFLYKK